MKKIKVYIAVVSTWKYEVEEYTIDEIRCFASDEERYNWAKEIDRTNDTIICNYEDLMVIKED